VKVLLVSQHFWPETFRINEVAQSLVEAGAEITVLTGKPNYPEGRIFAGYRVRGTQKDQFADIPVYRVPLIPRRRGSAVDLVLNYLSFVAAASLFGPWLLRGQKFDVVFVYGTSPILQAIPAILMKAMKRCRLVVWVQDLWPESLSATGFVRNRAVLGLVSRCVRWIYRKSDLLLVPSAAFTTYVSRLADPGKIAYHPNPGEKSLDMPAGTTTPCPISSLDSGFGIVFAGNIGTAQSVDSILDAAEKVSDLPDVRFILVGSGSRSEWAGDEIKRRGLSNVELAGRFPSEAMPAILGAASALLVSLADEEIFRLTVPAKVQAYLAAGKPVIAALDGEGARVIERAGAGLVAGAGDATALADAVRRLRGMSADERVAMGRNGRRYYEENFAPVPLARALLAHFDALSGGERKNGPAVVKRVTSRPPRTDS
jgi:glycosyltransferase involved in cell wall biosynthesis